MTSPSVNTPHAGSQEHRGDAAMRGGEGNRAPSRWLPAWMLALPPRMRCGLPWPEAIEVLAGEAPDVAIERFERDTEATLRRARDAA